MSGKSCARFFRHFLSPSRCTALPRAVVTSVFALLGTPVLASAPSVPAFGSFFPSWLLCLGGGVVTTVVLRVVFVLVGIDDILRWRVLSYMALAFALTLLFSMIFFGR